MPLRRVAVPIPIGARAMRRRRTTPSWRLCIPAPVPVIPPSLASRTVRRAGGSRGGLSLELVPLPALLLLLRLGRLDLGRALLERELLPLRLAEELGLRRRLCLLLGHERFDGQGLLARCSRAGAGPVGVGGRGAHDSRRGGRWRQCCWGYLRASAVYSALHLVSMRCLRLPGGWL